MIAVAQKVKKEKQSALVALQHTKTHILGHIKCPFNIYYLFSCITIILCVWVCETTYFLLNMYKRFCLC